MRPIRGEARLALLIAALLLVVACGSTVQDRSSLANGANNEFGGGTGTTGSLTPGPSGTGTFLPGQQGSQAGGTTGGYTTGASTGGTFDVNKNGPGVTPTQIFIGIDYCSDTSQQNQGLNNVSQGDPAADWKAAINDVNKHGGIAGRTVTAVYHVSKCTSTESVPAAYESQCQYFTRDHHVFAAMGAQATVYNYIACILKSGAILPDENVSDSDTQLFAQYPYYVEPANLAVDRYPRVMVPALAAQGYFGKNPNLGIVMFDTPTLNRALNNSFLPALAAYGYHVSSKHIARVVQPQSVSDYSALSSAISSAVLRFHTDNVNRVLFLQTGSGTLTLLFMREAQGQSYYPRYGLSSADAPQAVHDVGPVAARNFKDAVGIGWSPVSDQTRQDSPESSGNAQRKRCDKMFADAKITFSDSNAEAVGLADCDLLSFLKFTLDRAGPVVNQATFLAAVNRVGSQWLAATSMATFMGPDKHDGVSAYRWYGYNSSCDCMRYRSPVYSIG